VNWKRLVQFALHGSSDLEQYALKGISCMQLERGHQGKLKFLEVKTLSVEPQL
jgi:hypothetical protein